jgi:hypothetical protein
MSRAKSTACGEAGDDSTTVNAAAISADLLLADILGAHYGF